MKNIWLLAIKNCQKDGGRHNEKIVFKLLCVVKRIQNKKIAFYKNNK
jgi:hypothetical protein